MPDPTTPASTGTRPTGNRPIGTPTIEPRRIGVVGLGAVGGLIAARLVVAGHDVVGLARGATLEAVRRDGLVVGPEPAVRLDVVDDDPAVLGEVDLLVIAVKAPALADLAPRLSPMLGPRTLVVPAMNGVPWWFLPTPLHAIDPRGTIAAALPAERTLGCVVHLSAGTPAPGVVAHHAGERLILGEPGGGRSDRVEDVVALLNDAGFAAEASPQVRREIWYKLWGNMTVNPVSALTGAAGDAILGDDLVRGFMLTAMAEAAAVGAAVGCPIEESGETRLDLARALGPFRTSMLQDVDAGRRIELDALTGVVREIGARVGVPTPAVDALHGLTRLMGRVCGLY